MIEPINFVGAFRQRWRLVVVLAVIGAVVALLLPTSSSKALKTNLKWETFATVGAPASSGIIQGTVSNAQILFYANTFPVKLAAVNDVGMKGNPFVYAGGMFGSAVSPNLKSPYPTGPTATSGSTSKKASAGLITLYASGPTPTLAAALCNAFAKELGNTLEEVAAAHAATVPTPKAGGSSTASDGSPFAATSTGYQVVFPGTPQLARRINKPLSSTTDSHKFRLLAGLLFGALLAVVIILVRELLNRTIRRASRAEVHFKFPVVSEIPETFPPDSSVVDVVDRPTSPAAESYRKLRMSVLFESMAAEASGASGGDQFAEMFGMASNQRETYSVPEPGSRNVLLVVSTIDESARTKVVANLAATYAEAADRVIVVSTGELEVGTTFPADDIVTGDVTPADVESRLTPAGPENVWMLSMRHFMRNSGQLVSRSKEVFDAARSIADVVIVEPPAFLRFHHGEAMVHSVDAVLIVAEYGVTEAGDAIDMGDVLRRLGAPVLGTVFVGTELSASQRKILEAGMAASGRVRAGGDVGELDMSEDDELAQTEKAKDKVAVDSAAELHPS